MEKSLKPLFFTGLVSSLLLLTSAWWSITPLRDAALMESVTGFSLEISWVFLLFAPLFNTLDMLTALSLTQHIAVILTMLLLPLLVVLTKGRGDRTVLQMLFKCLKTIVFSFIFVFTLYAVTMLVPRPMSALTVSDSELVVVDFHSHTNHSHDANKYFTSDDNRWWHEHAGFNAVFVTDHKSFRGIIEGKQNNKKQAKGGVLLLDAIEAYHPGGHILALCATADNANEQSYEWQPIKGVTSICRPLLVQALPGPIEDASSVFKQRQIAAIELHDGAPLGLEEIKHRTQLLNKARELDIAVVSGSDNHGWAYAAVGWSALRIPNWQEMNADQLALAVTSLIRKDGFSAVQVIERNMLLPAATVLQHITMPVRLIWHMLQTLSLSERVSWFFWIWFLVFIIRKWKLN